MRLLVGIASENEQIVEELLAELPADGVLALSDTRSVGQVGMKSGGLVDGIIVDLLPGAVKGLFAAIAAFFARPNIPPTILVLETPDGKLNLSFNPSQLNAASMAQLVAQVTLALRTQALPSAADH